MSRAFRPPLRQVPLAEVLPLKAGQVAVTMSVGQWDRLLAVSYEKGCILLEMDDAEVPLRAFQRAPRP